MTDDDVRPFAMACHRIECFRNAVTNTDMMVGNAQMPGHLCIGSGTWLDPVPDDADRWEASVHCLTDKADIMPARREMLGQGCELTKATPVNKSHMHALRPFQDAKSAVRARD